MSDTAPRRERGLAWNSSALLSSRILKAALSWVGTVLIVRSLSVDDFGRFSLIFTILALTTVLTDLGIGRLVVRHLQHEPDDVRYVGVYLGLRMVLGVVGYAVALMAVVVGGYSSQVVGATAVAAVVIVLATPSSALEVVFQARMRLGPVAVADVLGTTAQVALTAAIAAAGGTVLLFVLPAIVFEIVVLVRKYELVRQLMGRRVRPHIDTDLWRRMLRDAIPLSIGLGLATAYTKVDALMLSKMVDFEAVAIYSVSYKFVDIVHFVSTAVTLPLLTLLVRHWPEEPAEFGEHVRHAVSLLALGGGAALVGLLGFAEPVTGLLYGDDYVPGADTTRVLAMAEMLAFASAVGVCALTAVGRTRQYPVAMGVGLVVNVALNLVLIPRAGYFGAGVATLLSNLVVVLLVWRAARSIPGVSGGAALATVARAAVAVGLGLGFGLAADRGLPWVLAAAIGIVVFVVSAALLGLLGRPVVRGPLRGGSPRLLVVSGSGAVSGAERVLLDLVASARTEGWQVSVLAPLGPLTDKLHSSGVDVVAIPETGGRGSGPRSLAGMLRRWATAGRRIRRAAASSDVVLVNTATALAAVRLASLRVPAVWLAHDVLVRRDRRLIYRLSRRSLARVVAVSHAVAAALPEGGPEVVVVHNGVAPRDGTAPGLEEGTVVGVNALLTPWKGHRVVLEAARHLPDGVTVELLGGHLPGDAAYAAALEDEVADSALTGRVVFAGHTEDPEARMRRWTVAVSASLEPEACPLNVLEAMSLGVPVVATDHGGAPEILAGAGLLVPPGDPEALARAIRMLLDDSDLRARCVARGRHRVAESHDKETQLRRLVAVLAETAGVGPHATASPVTEDERS